MLKTILLCGIFHSVPCNSSAAIFCKPDVLLSTEQRAFEFSYTDKDEWNLSSFKAEWGYVATGWAYELQLTELHEATKSRKMN